MLLTATFKLHTVPIYLELSVEQSSCSLQLEKLLRVKFLATVTQHESASI